MNHTAPVWTRPGPQLAAYAALLVATPFLLLRSYLQLAIGTLSRHTVPVLGHEVLVIPLLAALPILLAAYGLRRRMHRGTPAVLALVAVLWLAGHQVADFYFGHRATDLQHNWHTLAYLGFAALAWRLNRRLGRPAQLAPLPGLLLALLVSAGDETIQVFLSSRIFDVGDIGKDAWGAAIGFTALSFHEAWPALRAEGWRPWRPAWRDYRHAAVPQLLATLLLAGGLLLVGSHFTERQYLGWVLLLWLGGCGLAALTLHAAGKRIGRRVLAGLAVVLAVAQAASCLTHPWGRVNACGRGWVLYGGFLLPVFDVLVLPSGWPRPVDKKHAFNQRDQGTLFSLDADVLVVGSGYEGRGGLGFPEPWPVQFVPDPEFTRPIQLVVLPTPEACAVYNRLRDEGRRVAFVIHTTC